MSCKVYHNCKLLKDHSFVSADLWVRAGKILNPDSDGAVADEMVDCQGCLLAPGFIDVHTNGAFGVDFSVPTDHLLSDVQRVAHGLLAHGVTSFCPTIVTSKPETYAKVLPEYKKTAGSCRGAGILGLHLEGPFISKEKRGAHSVDCLSGLSRGLVDVLDMYGSLDNVAILTLAPELPGALEAIKDVSSRGIIVSLGHTTANLAAGEAAVKAGARFITHLFNAMQPFHHRDPHLVGLLASSNLPPDVELFYSLIADFVHTHPTALKIAHRINPTGVVLITDAVAATGLPPGRHRMGPQTIEVLQDHRAVVAGTDILCGSIATMNQCVKYFHQATGCSKAEALQAASSQPAKLLGITDQKGTLAFGSDADFVLLDEQLNVLATFIAGEQVWGSEQFPLHVDAR